MMKTSKIFLYSLILLSTLFVLIEGFFCYVSFELSIASNYFEKFDVIKKYNILHSMWYITIFLFLFLLIFCFIIFLLIREQFRKKIRIIKRQCYKKSPLFSGLFITHNI
jgi:uncharacterized BrkB/YihY/UPF0761 family membrane protein